MLRTGNHSVQTEGGTMRKHNQAALMFICPFKDEQTPAGVDWDKKKKSVDYTTKSTPLF